MALWRKNMFEESHKAKLENPAMTLNEWSHLFYSKPVIIRISKVVAKKALSKKIFYQIKQTDPLWPNTPLATRTKSDFKLLYSQLCFRFPNAVVPNLPSLSKENEIPLLETYLMKLSANPFFRADVAFVDFVDGKFKEFKQTKKKDRKQSEGTLRWLQCLTEYPVVNSQESYLKGLKADFEALERTQKSLVKAFGEEVKVLDQLRVTTNVVRASFEELLAMETASEKRKPASVAGAPDERLSGKILETINVTSQHYSTLGRAYSGSTFSRVMITPILYDLQVIASFKKTINQVMSKKSDYDRAKAALEGLGDVSESAKRKAKENKDEKYVVYHKQRQALNYELETFKTFRTVNFDKFFHDYVSFNLRGSNEIYKQWAQTGVQHDKQTDEKFFSLDQEYGRTLDSKIEKKLSSSSKSNFSKVENESKKSVKLMVTANFTPRGVRSKFLKVNKGDILAGHRAENGHWYAVDKHGKKGLVDSAYVAVKTQNNQQSSRENIPFAQPVQNYSNRPSIQNFSAPPGLDFQESRRFTDHGSKLNADEDDYDVQEDWSVSDDGANQPAGSDRKTPPQQFSTRGNPESLGKSFSPPTKPKAPMLPPGLTVSKKAAETSKPFTPPNQSFKPPKSSPPGVAVNGTMNHSPPAGFNDPGQRPDIPSFGGAPGSAGFQATSYGIGSPPMPNRETKSTPPKPKPNQKPVSKPVSKPAAKSAAKPKLGGGPGGRPGGPPPMAMGFLADIKKGNQATKLKKVPDAEKSKEIGGKKTVKSAGGGGRGGAPGFGGGGGMLGELQAKLNKRR